MVVSHARSWSEHCEKFDQSYTMIMTLSTAESVPNHSIGGGELEELDGVLGHY